MVSHTWHLHPSSNFPSTRGKIQHKQNKCSQGCTNIGRLGLARSLQQTQTKFDDVVYH